MFSNFRTADELMSQQEPDPLPSWTNEPCPFCGQRIQWDGDQLFCAPCLRTWAGWDDVRFDRHEVRYAERKAAQVAAEEALMWEYYYEGDNDQRDEDEDGHGNTVAVGLERWTR
jgi:hypothetical protein